MHVSAPLVITPTPERRHFLKRQFATLVPFYRKSWRCCSEIVPGDVWDFLVAPCAIDRTAGPTACCAPGPAAGFFSRSILVRAAIWASFAMATSTITQRFSVATLSMTVRSIPFLSGLRKSLAGRHAMHGVICGLRSPCRRHGCPLSSCAIRRGKKLKNR
jgi:hypothetical protein